MNKEEVEKKIMELLNEITPETEEKSLDLEQASQNLTVNSLIFLQLLTNVEKAFSMHIEDDYWEYNKLSSIEKIAEYVVSNQ